MANPQPDSFTRLSNELLEAIMKSDFSKRQYNILFLIWRCSYGFDQKVAKLKKCDFQAVGVYPADIAKELNYLKETKVIFWDENNNLVAFNKDYDRWRISLSKTAVNGNVDFKKILKRQFKDFKAELSENVDENISKILSLDDKKVSKTPTKEENEVGETLNNEDEQVSKTLTKENDEVSETPTSDTKEVSKTLTKQSSEPNGDADSGTSKETSTKETSTKEINALRDVKDTKLNNIDTEEDDDFHPAYKKVLDYAKQKIVVNYLSREYLINEDLKKYNQEILMKAIELAVMRQKSQGKYTRGDPKNGVDIGSWKYVQCFIDEAKEVLEGGNDNGSNPGADNENNGENQKDEGARLQKKAFELMGFEEG